MTTRPIQDPASTTTTTTTAAAATTSSTIPRPASPPLTPAASSSSSLSSRVTASPPATPLYSAANPLSNRTASLASASTTTPEIALQKAWEIITQAQVTHDLNASYKYALLIANDALEQHPKNGDLWALKATCHFNLAQYEQATDAACKALEHDADNGVAMSVLMDCEEARNAPPVPIYRSSPSRSPLNEHGFRVALDRILSIENPTRAQEEIERIRLDADAVLERDSSDTTAFCLKIFCSIFQGRMLDVDLMEFLQNPMRADQIVELFEKTRPIVEEVVRKKADCIPALVLRMGCICYEAQRENMKAIFQHSMGRHSGSEKEKPEDVLLLLTGTVDVGQRRFFAEPLAAAEELLRYDPKNRAGLIVRIEALRMLGRLDEARRMVDAVLQDFPQDDFFWTLQSLCCLSMNDPRGLKSAHEALRLNPKTNTLAHFVKLAFLCKEKEIDAIIAAVLEAREQFPSNPFFKEFEKYYLSEERMNDKK